MAKLLLSFDFEDWHQLVHRRLGRDDWDAPGPALERQTETIFALLDELGARATFFVLGMTAERYPDLVREIAAPGPRARLPRLRARAGARPERGRVPPRRRALRRAPRAARRPAAARLPRARLLDHPRHAVGLRGTRRARLPLRLEPVRLAADPAADPAACRRPRTGSSCRQGARSGSFRSPSGAFAAASVPIGGGAYWRVLPAAILRRALRQVADENAYPVLYFHPYELDPRPLRAALPGSRNPAAAAARRLEERAAKPRQAARRGSDSCNRPGVPARQLRGGTWRSRRTLRSSSEITFARRRPRLTPSTTKSTRSSGRRARGCSSAATSRSTSSASTTSRACSTSAAAPGA